MKALGTPGAEFVGGEVPSVSALIIGASCSSTGWAGLDQFPVDDLYSLQRAV